LAESGIASLTILDLNGHEVATLVGGQVDAGRYTAVWNTDRQAAGMYSYRLQAGSYQHTKKLMLIK
jgi:hypothetical protein